MLRGWSPRRWLGAGAVVAIGLLALNVSGLLRYPGGPMREPTANGIGWLDTKPADQQGGFGVGMPEGAGLTTDDIFVTTVFLTNAGPWDASLESVELVDATSGLRLTSARLVLSGFAASIPAADMGTPADIERRYPDTHLGSFPQTVVARSDPHDGQVILELQVAAPGEYSYRGVRVGYRLGPFSFQAVYGQGARLCFGPLGANQSCPGDSADAAG